MSLGAVMQDHLQQDARKAPLLQVARAVHMTHKNKPLFIKEKSPLYYLYRDTAPVRVIKKAVQIGVSEYLIAKAIKDASEARNVIYILPTFLLKNQFVQDRINKSIMFTGYYKDLARHDDKKMVESTSLKQFGRGSIIFAGSNTPVAFISHPGDTLIIDEEDQCDEGNLVMAEERLARSDDPQVIRVSNPTFLGKGIDYQYNMTDKKEWYIKHTCGNWIQMDWFKQVVSEVELPGGKKAYVLCDKDWHPGAKRDIQMFCDICGKFIDRQSEGEFISQTTAPSSGYHMSSLFASSVDLKKMLSIFMEGQRNDTQMQRFYNAYLGLAYNSAGAKITAEMLDECIDENHTLPSLSGFVDGPTIAGIDVGKVFNVIIARPLPNGKLLTVYFGEPHVDDLKEILSLFRQYKVKLFVIDALPEQRLSRKLIAKWRQAGGHGFANLYTSSKAKEISWDTARSITSVDRTYVLDAVKEQILLQNIILPANAKSIPNFYSQMTASTRAYDEKRDEYVWVEAGPDHYFHAMAYLYLAKQTLVQAG